MDIRFVVNLRNDTTSDLFREDIRPKGWLSAPENLTAGHRDQLPELRQYGRWFFADNGNFKHIGDLAETLDDRRSALMSRIDVELQGTTHPPDARYLSPDILNDLASVAAEAKSRSQAVVLAHEDRWPLQFALSPTHAIGEENITCALWIRLGLNERLLPKSRQELRALNRQVAREASRHDNSGVWVYPVASAFSYNTAFDAGREFAAAGHQRISMGFGAYMADNSYTDEYKVGRRWIKLGRRLGNRYLSTALVARGFADGYVEEAGRMPKAFHCLGLGAITMMAVVGRALQGCDLVTFDAMSPIFDAVQGTMYVTKPAYLKIRTLKVAQRLASHRAEEWRCPCASCREFVTRYPFDYGSGRNWWNDGATKVTQADLRLGGGLHEAYPLLSFGGASDMRKEANAARQRHNHWAIHRVVAAMQRASRDGTYDRYLDRVVSNYVGHTNSQIFADSLMTAAGAVRDPADPAGAGD